ncbi:unnamed protein product [Sphagnum balticum]
MGAVGRWERPARGNRAARRESAADRQQMGVTGVQQPVCGCAGGEGAAGQPFRPGEHYADLQQPVLHAEDLQQRGGREGGSVAGAAGEHVHERAGTEQAVDLQRGQRGEIGLAGEPSKSGEEDADRVRSILSD